MTGGLMNLTAIGAENIILNGNPKKHILKQRITNVLILVYRDLE